MPVPEDVRDLLPLTVDVRAALLGGGLATRTLDEIAPYEELRPRVVVEGIGAIGSFVDGAHEVSLLSEPPEVLSSPVIVSISKRDLTAIERADFAVPGSAIDGLGPVLLGGTADAEGALSVVSLDGNVQPSSLRVTRFDRRLKVLDEVAGDVPYVQEPSAHLQFSVWGRARARLQRAVLVGESLVASDFQDGRLYRFDRRTMAQDGLYQVGRPLHPDRRKPLPGELTSPDWAFHVDASTGGVIPLAPFDRSVWASRTVYADESIAVIRASDPQGVPRTLRLSGGFVWSPPQYVDVLPRVRDLVPSGDYLWVTGMEEVRLGRRGMIRIGDACLGRLTGYDGDLELVPLRTQSQENGDWCTLPRTVVNAITAWHGRLYATFTQFTQVPQVSPRSYLGVVDERTGLLETVVDITRFRAEWPILTDLLANEVGVWLWVAATRNSSRYGSVFVVEHEQLKPNVVADTLDTD